MQSFRDYLHLYNISDVLILAEIFENFRDVCIDNYGLDPTWYYTSPGLAWDAMLKTTDVKLELISDPDMALMIEKGIRGGVAMISHRHGKANNRYMGKRAKNRELVNVKNDVTDNVFDAPVKTGVMYKSRHVQIG